MRGGVRISCQPFYRPLAFISFITLARRRVIVEGIFFTAESDSARSKERSSGDATLFAFPVRASPLIGAAILAGFVFIAREREKMREETRGRKREEKRDSWRPSDYPRARHTEGEP